jgi:hypothetical protein
MLSKLKDETQRNIIIEAIFESLDVVDRLAWLADNDMPEELKKRLTNAGTGLLRGHQQAEEG